jgi:phosphoribosyl 1,2-cyclic phosphodiesterase
MSKGTAISLGIENHYRVFIPRELKPMVLANWIVRPFPLEHDAVEPWGFTILHLLSNERLLFIPDTAYVKNRFEGVTILAIECNFVPDILHDKIISGALPAVVGHRVRRNHMSLDQVIEMIKANDLSGCREIWLLHLSDTNSDESRMIKAVQSATGIPCRAAQ